MGPWRPWVCEPGQTELASRSSVGKTLCLLVAGSVFGPSTRQSLPSWDKTPTGLEELAAAHSPGRP
jgi:uncharacterized protein (DUF927 family)